MRVSLDGHPRFQLIPAGVPKNRLGKVEQELALTVLGGVPRLIFMVVHLKPETESRLRELSATTGREPGDLVEDAMAGYLAEIAQTREMRMADTTRLRPAR